MINKGRKKTLSGADTYNAKFSESDVIEIKTLLKNNISQKDIANKFNENPVVICKIKTGKSYKNVQETE